MAVIVPIPPETPQARITRLENEIAACRRNHALLLKGAPKVVSNNDRLRSGIRDVIARLPDDPDVGPVAEKLEAALLIPFPYRRDMPTETPTDDMAAPEDQTARIAFLEDRLRTLSRGNYLVQEAGAPVVWNSDAIRAVVGELIRELDPDPVKEGEPDPTRSERATVLAIVDGLQAVLKAAADRPDK